MKIGKIEAVLLAAIMVCGTMSFALPAMAASTSTQTANVYATDAVLINNSDRTTAVTGWTFTGAASTTVANPTNTPQEETQNTTANEPVATLVNTNPLAVTITLNAATWSPEAVTAQGYNISAADNSVDFGSFATLSVGSPTTTGIELGANNKFRGLYLNATLAASAGTGESAFTVTCEV